MCHETVAFLDALQAEKLLYYAKFDRRISVWCQVSKLINMASHHSAKEYHAKYHAK